MENLILRLPVIMAVYGNVLFVPYDVYYMHGMMGDQLVNEDTFITFMTEVEKIMNDRPITPVPDDIDDLAALMIFYYRCRTIFYYYEKIHVFLQMKIETPTNI